MAAPLVAERYRILDRIGEGGLGVVYRVEDLVAREIRALKVMPRAAGRANLRAEFLALARLEHDNIVRVFDYGLTAAGDDYFTMELVDGRDLRAVAPPPSDPVFYQLVGGVLRALAFLHARGIVHADVKPSNVLVCERVLVTEPARAAKLLDFGLAAHAADPSAAAARGTFPYAAPEVYAGRVDARSDLYALGVLLYELVTGQTPFSGTDVGDVIRRQRRGAPPDPRTLRPQLSAGLAELILALLEPEPGARLQTADEVLARVNEIAGTRFELAGERPRVDLTGTLVGRERDLAQLVGMWERAATGAGGVALLFGEEGIGKSRLLGELKLRLQLTGARVYVGSAAARPGQPYAGLAEIARALVVDASEAARRPALAPLLGPTPGATGPGARAGETDADSRFVLAEAFAGLLLERAAAQPIAIVLDDLHAAGRGTLELFAYLARAASAGRVLMVGAARGDRDDGGEPLGAALAHAEHVERIHLAPLDRASVRTLVSAIFGATIADALAVDLHRASGGNPAFLGRALEALLETGVVGRQRGEWILLDATPTIPIPPDAVAAALARADALPAPMRRVLDAAAVLGERFDLSTLAAVAGADAPLADALSTAIAERLLVSGEDAEEFEFAHGGVRDALYARLDGAERVRLHRAAAAHLDARPGAPAAARAEHHLAVGDRAQAIASALAAAEEHVAALDFHGALRWYDRVLPLVAGDGARAAQVAERRADVRAVLGDQPGACDEYRRAHDAYAEPADQVRVTRKLGELLRRRGQSDEAIERLMKGLAQARAARLTADEAACHFTLARVRMYRNEYPAAIEHASAGLALARAAGERELCARILVTRADIEIYRGDPRGAQAHLEAALAEAAELSEALLADVHHARGRAFVHAGEYARAIESLERAIAGYQRVGRVVQETYALNNLGAACYFQGEWDRARSCWERFRRLCERIDESVELVNALNNLGSLYKDRGELGEALAALDRARAVAERTGRAHMAAMALGNRGEVLARQGDFVGARQCYERCLKLFESLGAREDLIETRRRLCELDVMEGRIEPALDRVIDAARDAQMAGARLEEAALHRVAATALRFHGDLDSATWFVERAREMATTLGARYERAKVDVEAAELAAARGRPQDAEAALARAAEVFAQLGARWDLARARERRRALAPVRTVAGEGALSGVGLGVLLDVALASGRMELEKLLEIVLDKILEVTRFERGFILLLDERGRPTERMRRSRAREAGAFDRAAADFSGSIVRRVAQSGESVAVTDIADDAALRDQKSIVALGLRSVMCVPMRRHGRVTGIIYVDSRRLAEEERAGDLALLEALAAQAAIGIENARLVAEEQRKTDLMAILAHEIRNPLAGILGYSDLSVAERTRLSPDAIELLDRIHRDGQRLKRLVDNVLELARVEAGKVEWSMAPVRVAELLEDARAAYDPLAAKKRIALGVACAPDVPPVLGNADRLFQVLSNLIGNALKFTPDGGRITLAARAETLTQVEPSEPGAIADDDLGAWVPLAPEAGTPRPVVRIDVIDTGPGIPPERRAHLFEKFAQGEEGRRSSCGVGLGLYISREIIRRHGGVIWVESEPGKGSCFSFRVPAAT